MKKLDNTYRRLLATLAALLTVLSVSAQFDTQLSQYWAMPAYYNPAATGTTDYLHIGGGTRLQWIGIPKAPKAFLAGADMPVKLFGKRIGVGAPNSGVEINARMIFEAHGMTYKDVKIDYLNYGEAIDQMKNGLIDAAFVTSGLGNATIRELGVSKKIAFVPVDGEARQRLIKKYPFYIESTIPAATYGTASDTPTAAVMNILVADKKLPADVVYDLLKNIFSPTGLETIQGSHATAKANIKPETALRGIVGTAVPLHEGAIRYYKEVGLMK